MDDIGDNATGSFTFMWDKATRDSGTLAFYHNGTTRPSNTGDFTKFDVLQFGEFLNLIPAWREELLKKIRKRETEAALF